FFFQAEDGIRDLIVTGVQTCALPISWFFVGALAASDSVMPTFSTWVMEYHPVWAARQAATDSASPSDITRRRFLKLFYDPKRLRSEERRVGKECNARRWWGQ